MSERPAFWGWHQLDSRIAIHLVHSAAIEPGDLVIDIGAGTGAITRPLLAAGATVVAVELHPGRAAALRQQFSGRVTVVQADAADLRLPRRPFKVVANPPFAVSTAIMRRLTHPGSRLQHASVVLPEWAAVRWATGHGVGGVTSNRTFHLALGPRVRARSFRPHAPADAAVLYINRTEPIRRR